VSTVHDVARALRLAAAEHGGRPLREARRYSVAIRDRVRAERETYSQHGEDRHIAELLKGRDLSSAIYIDVGANHPTLISNTYLLYRRGVRGIVVEPNVDLVRLHRLVRPDDVQVAVGCGERAELGRLAVMSAGVLSTFAANAQHTSTVQRYDYVPILPLDAVVDGAALPHRWICLLSIDTEGFDLEVLKGARRTLAKTYVICVETNTDAERDAVSQLLASAGFEEESRADCNTFYVNRTLRIEAA
jgi:FkbM family methyltransferase